jgi:hypothetical protein
MSRVACTRTYRVQCSGQNRSKYLPYTQVFEFVEQGGGGGAVEMEMAELFSLYTTLELEHERELVACCLLGVGSLVLVLVSGVGSSHFLPSYCS